MPQVLTKPDTFPDVNGGLNRRQNGKTLLNVGCGKCAPPDWHNIDASPRAMIASIPFLGRLLPGSFPASVKYGNIIRGLSLRPESCRAIFCCHTLEHLAYRDALRALTNIFSLLSPDGAFRVIVPNMRILARDYIEHTEDDAASRLMRWSGLGEETIPSPMARLFGNSRHRWMWDEKSLAQVLRNTGFTNIRSCAFGDNSVFQQVESADRYDFSVALEAGKVTAL